MFLIIAKLWKTDNVDTAQLITIFINKMETWILLFNDIIEIKHTFV